MKSGIDVWISKRNEGEGGTVSPAIGKALYEVVSANDINSLTNQDYSRRKLEGTINSLNDKKRLGESIYMMFGYPSKIFYKKIAKFIDRYTVEGDLVLDPLCGSGSTGISSLWKRRKCLLMDGSSGAAFIAKCHVLPVDLVQFRHEFMKIKKRISDRVNSLYEIKCKCDSYGIAEYVICSNVYSCPECGSEIILSEGKSGKRSTYICPNCRFQLNISKQWHKKCLIEKRRPIEAKYHCLNPTCGKKRLRSRKIGIEDIDHWQRKLQENEEFFGSLWSPNTEIVYNRCYPRKGGWPGFPIGASVSDLFTRRNLFSLSLILNEIEEINEIDIRKMMKFCFLGSLIRSSMRVFETSVWKGVYHVPPLGKEQNVWKVFERKFNSIVKAKKKYMKMIDTTCLPEDIRVLKHSAYQIPLPDNSVDYVFTDPPYGGAVPYYELNLFYSSWLREEEDFENEIIIPMDYDKIPKYAREWGNQIERAFREIYRVMKPERYFTVVFQSKFDAIWNEFRDIMLSRIGFEFVEIFSNIRGTTFHTNLENDTNPKSVYITYKKPAVLNNRRRNTWQGNQDKTLREEISRFVSSGYSNGILSLRSVQSEVIEIVHREHLQKMPSEEEIVEILRNLGYEYSDCTRGFSKS